MRARKRNPWLGRGLDKRQARRARRRTERRLARVEALMDEHTPEFKLMPWQRDVLRASQGRPFHAAAVSRARESRRYVLDKWVSERTGGRRP